MTTVLLFLTVAAFFIFAKIYGGEDKRLPPASTLKGRQARIVGGVILLVGAVVLVFNVVGQGASRERLFAIEEVLLGVAVAIIFALMRMGRKSK